MMNDPQSVATRASHRGLVALVALAFVAGLTFMAYAAKRWHWFDDAGTAAVVERGAPAAIAPAVAQPVAAAIDPATLATREATLAGQLAALEARTAAITTDAAAAGDRAARAEAVLVAAAARRQVDRGQPLGYLEEQVRQRFAATQPRAVTLLLAGARQPVTLDELSAGLDALSSRLSSAPEDDWIDGLRRELATLVVLRRPGTASPLSADRLAHARRLLAAGQVDEARAEVAALPGASLATNWLAAARRWLLVHQALDTIESTALIAPPPVPTPAPVAAAPVTPPPTVTTIMP